jgi:hypothetical protein
MACDLSSGRLEVCKDSVGGLKAVYFVNYGDIGAITYDVTNTDVIDSVTDTPSASVKDHKELKLMAYGRPNVIVEDNNGNFFLAGLENGCDVTGGTIVTGGAMGDLSGYTLTLTGQEKVPANFIGDTLADAGFTVVVGS